MDKDEYPWTYLTHPILQSRQIIAANVLKWQVSVIEIGGGATPLFPYMWGDCEQFIEIDPIQIDTISSPIYHRIDRKLSLDVISGLLLNTEYAIDWGDLGLVALGLDILGDDECDAFVALAKRASKIVLEYALDYDPAVGLKDRILAEVDYLSLNYMGLDYSRNADTIIKLQGDFQPRLNREMAIIGGW